MTSLRILVVGAGVLGSVYAARLAEVGYPVSIVARGLRAKEIEDHGIVLVDEATGRRTVTRLPVVRELRPTVDADVALVLVRREQLDALLPALGLTPVPSILFMTNNAAGPEFLELAVGRERVLLGFPGAGGSLAAGVVRYRLVSRLVQRTTIGEVDGRRGERLRAIGEALDAAGFPVTTEPRMDAWLKTHASVVAPVAHAIYAAGGSTHALSRRPRLVTELVLAVRDNLAVLRALEVPVTPSHYGLLFRLPTGVLVAILAAGMRTERAELVLARHANAARDEMAAIDADLDRLRSDAGIAAPRAAALADRALRAKRTPRRVVSTAGG